MGRRSIHRRSRCSENCETRQSTRHLGRSRGERASRGSHPWLLSRAMQSDTHIHRDIHTRLKSSFVVSAEERNAPGRRRMGEGTAKSSRGREARESPGKPATALDGRRDHTLTSTPTFRGPPPGHLFNLSRNRLLHLILHLHTHATTKKDASGSLAFPQRAREDRRVSLAIAISRP